MKYQSPSVPYSIIQAGHGGPSVSVTDTPTLVIILLATVPRYPHHLLSMEGNSKMPSVPLKCLIVSHAYTHYGDCI